MIMLEYHALLQSHSTFFHGYYLSTFIIVVTWIFKGKGLIAVNTATWGVLAMDVIFFPPNLGIFYSLVGAGCHGAEYVASQLLTTACTMGSQLCILCSLKSLLLLCLLCYLMAGSAVILFVSTTSYSNGMDPLLRNVLFKALGAALVAVMERSTSDIFYLEATSSSNCLVSKKRK